nr:uncharacterized protein LOC125423310 [Ziziphus jujuba var. spinosa]
MDSEVSFTAIAPPVFDGTNYQMWAVRMVAYLHANDLWEAVEQVYEATPLPNNPTVAQIRTQKERKQRKSKAKASLFTAISPTIFTGIMTLKTANEIWDFLKQEYEGNERVRGMQVLNLIRELEVQKMRESETIKEYFDRLLSIANKVRLLGTDFFNSRIVQKILVTIPEKFEATISSLENSKDLSSITLAELLNALQAQEQRRLMRQEGFVEGAFQAKSQYNNVRAVEKICKSRQQQGEAKAAENQPQEEELFVVSRFATNNSTESWLIDSGCTNHMTYDRELFRELNKTVISKVRIGNGAYIAVKGKRIVAIDGHTGLKLNHDVLYVPEINQNLLSVAQLLEKGYKVLFEDKNCMIKDSEGDEVFRVQMKGKNFALDLMKVE